GLSIIDPGVQYQVFQLKHLRNAASTTVSWGKDIVLDLIQWRVASTHRLAFLLAPRDGLYRWKLTGFPSLQPLVVAAGKLSSLKAAIIHAGLPESSTFVSTPLEWCLPSKDNTITPLSTRIDKQFTLELDANNRLRITNKSQL
ncbi:hypothetical protein BGX33_003114, partial [Mortierella sp. NVP41]